jgi:hypothetical protein
MKNATRFLYSLSLGFLCLGCSSSKEETPTGGGNSVGQQQGVHQRVRSRVQEVETCKRLRDMGVAYINASTTGRPPRSFDDLLEHTERQPKQFLSVRDEQQFEVVWGVNLNNAPNAILAWEKTADVEGGRCVLMVSGAAQYLTKEDWDRTPKAKGR